jgi:hypothetical protein
MAVGKCERAAFSKGAAPVFSATFCAAHFARELLRRPVSQTAVRPAIFWKVEAVADSLGLCEAHADFLVEMRS